MKRFYRTTFIILGSVSFILTVGFCLQMPLLTGILPPTGSFPLHIFLASITASIGASLLWIGFSGELGAAAAGAIDLAVFYAGVTIFQLLAAQHGSQRLLAGVLLCSAAAIVSLGIFLRFRRYPIEDRRLMPLPVRVSFAVFVVVLLLVGSALLLRVPNVFAWTLNPASSALVSCFFLGSACYFLYGLLFSRWHTACGQLWSFLAYDLVLIVPFLFRFATVSTAQLPSLIVNTVILVYSGTLALYYPLIKKETRSLAKLSESVITGKATRVEQIALGLCRSLLYQASRSHERRIRPISDILLLRGCKFGSSRDLINVHPEMPWAVLPEHPDP